MRISALLPFILAIALASCAKKSANQDAYQPVQVGPDLVRNLPFEPTNPTGGQIPDKLAEMSVEEVARRKARNEIEPVAFGTSVSGISMQTSWSQAESILAPPLGSDGTYVYYPERIAIAWGSGADPLPRSIAVLQDYAGKLTLPAPVGSIFVGEELTRYLGAQPSESALRSYMRTIGAALEGKGSDYDCEVAQTCRLSYRFPGLSDRITDFEFARGSMSLLGDGRLTLNELIFLPPRSLPARLTGPLVYATRTIDTFTLTSTRTAIEARVGSPLAEDSSFLFYDRGALVVLKGSGPQIVSGLIAQLGYQGSMNFGGAIGQRYLGDAFAAYAPAGDNGIQLMLALDRLLENRAPDFDCRTLPEPCRATLIGSQLVIELAKGTFGFTSSAERTWLYFQID